MATHARHPYWAWNSATAEIRPFVLRPRTVLSALLVFVGYYLGSRIGFALTFEPHPVSVLWPPNSILLAALLLTRRRAWWILLLAAFSAQARAAGSRKPPVIRLRVSSAQLQRCDVCTYRNENLSI
jgi:hypothetical protein